MEIYFNILIILIIIKHGAIPAYIYENVCKLAKNLGLECRQYVYNKGRHLGVNDTIFGLMDMPSS